MMQAMHRALGLADPKSDLRRREACDMAQDEDVALVLRQAAEGLAQRIVSAPGRPARGPSSLARISSQGICRRVRRWSRAALRATRMIHATNGTSRGS